MEQGTAKPTLYPFTAPKTKEASCRLSLTPGFEHPVCFLATLPPN